MLKRRSSAYCLAGGVDPCITCAILTGVATPTRSRSDLVRALPTFSEAAKLIGLDPSGITRAVERLGIEPEMWGAREKHLTVSDLLRIAEQAQRASLEEVAGGLIERTERDHSEQLDHITAEIDRFLDRLPEPSASEPAAFVTELRAALPKRWAERAEAIYRHHARSS